MGGGSYLSHCGHKFLQQTFVGEQECLYNIISAMVAFLNADSHFVRHVAGNIILSISQFLIKHECLWAKLLQLIWFILEDALSAIFSCPESSAPAVIHVHDNLMLHEETLGDITKDQNLKSARFLVLLKSRLLKIMMIRLSFHGHWKNSYPQSWLKLLHQFFGEILHQSLGRDAGSISYLEESPFFTCSAEVDKSYAGHLHRQTIFLLFKCSLTRVCVDEASKECPYNKDEIVSSSCGLQLCWKRCHLGLLETFAWLQRWCPPDKFQNCKNYPESCSSFASTFLQLYMEEDDLLFKMLLLLLDAPFSMWQKESSNKNGFLGENEDMLCHFSSIFCPVRLFHLFLLLLHYDHLVLIDYLISKDTGIDCLQYLLRCLRLIYISWPAFMQFSFLRNVSDDRYQKRRKIPPDEDESPALLSSTTAFRRQIMRREKKFQCAYGVSDSHTFEKAKGCLHSLKISLGELQRKSLFPYNSKPLLKSLNRFLELT